MKKISVALIYISLIVFQGCATIVKSPQTVVTFQGNVHSNTEIVTPYGSTTLRNGISSMVIPNNKKDIQIQIICNQQKPVNAVLPTNYSIGAGVFGNLGLTLLWVVPGVIGFVVDLSGDTAYVPTTPFNVTQYCRQ